MNVVPLPLPWLELSIVLSLIGALLVARFGDPLRAWRWGLVFTGMVFACTLIACVGFYLCRETQADATWSCHQHMLGRSVLGIDELNAPLLPLVGLIHFLIVVATGRTKMRHFSLTWSLTSEAIRLATFGCLAPWWMIGFMALSIVPPYAELRNRGKSTRIFIVHHAAFVLLLVVGWALVDPTLGYREQSSWMTLPLVAAILIRCGTIPAHCWITDWFENASFGNALLYLVPLSGVYLAIRLVLPVAPDAVLHVVGLISLVTAAYAACLSVVQQDTRRLFAYLFISHTSLVLVGMDLHTSVSLTGALALWMSAALSLTGFGLTLRALEARYGTVSLAGFHGHYEQSPALAVCFLLTGLACVGFPGTLGFVSTELLVDGAIQASPYVGFSLALIAAINGIAVVRAYFRLFTGTRHASTISLNIGPRERFAVLTITALILGGGIWPQFHVASRYRAAGEVLQRRGVGVEPEKLDDTTAWMRSDTDPALTGTTE
jgi:NADH-quinone oxidoreductase subunit M